MRRNKFIKGEKVVLDTGKSTYFVTVMDWFTVDGKTWYNLAEDYKPFCFWGPAPETQLRARLGYNENYGIYVTRVEYSNGDIEE